MTKTEPEPDNALWQACQHPGESAAVWLARWRLVRQMLSASDRATVTAAIAAARTWLRDHPNDITVLSAGESLGMVADYLDHDSGV